MSVESAAGALPWRVRIPLWILSMVTDFARRSNGTINRRITNFVDPKSPPNPVGLKGVRSSDVTVDASRTLWFRLFVPENVTDSKIPVVVFFHGGGFAFLGPDSKPYDAVCRRFARILPAVIVSVNYRLTPENKFPCQYDDGFDVLKFLDDGFQLPEVADLGRCFLAGDSAGGNICHHVVLRASRLDKKMERVRLAGVVSIQPFFGGKEVMESEIRLSNAVIVSFDRTEWMWKALLPEGSNRDHEAANVCKADISSIQYPPTLVFVGGLDPLQDWQRRYYEWLKRCGKEALLVEYPNAIHAFYVFPEFPESKLLRTEFQNFVHSH